MNKTMQTVTTPHNSIREKCKKGTALLLVMCILIASAYAFLTAQDSKTNVFTVGSIKIKLNETKLTTGLGVDGDLKTIEVAENIVPGDKFVKDPTLENIGKNPAYGFLSVSIPTGKIVGGNTYTELFSYEFNTDDWVPIVLKDNDKGYVETIDENNDEFGQHIYYFYYNKPIAVATETESIFKEDDDGYAVTFVDSDGTDAPINYDALTDVESIKIVVNGYACQTKLDNKEIGPAKAWNTIRDKVEIPEAVEPVIVAYYAKTKTGNVAAATTDLSNKQFDNISDYEVVAYEEIMPGGTISELYWNDQLQMDGYSFDWEEYSSHISAYPGMTVDSNLNFVASYNEAETNDEIPDEYLMFDIYSDGTATFMGYMESLNTYMQANNIEIFDLTIPSSVTISGSSHHQGDIVRSDEQYLCRIVDDSYRTTSTTTVVEDVYFCDETTFKRAGLQTYIGYFSMYTTTQMPNAVTVIYDGTHYYSPRIDANNDELFPFQTRERNAFGYYDVTDLVVTATDNNNRDELKALPENMNHFIIMPYLSSKITYAATFGYAYCVNKLVIPDTVSVIHSGGSPENTFSVYDNEGNATYVKDYIATKYDSDIVAAFAEKGITISSCSKYLDDGTQLSELVLPYSLKTISAGAFNSSNLTKVLIPNSITEINDLTFAGCPFLANVELPDGLKTIGKAAFHNCRSLTAINLKNVEEIKPAAFQQCSGLASIQFSDKLSYLSAFVFSSCSGLTSLYLPENIKTIGIRAFQNCSGLIDVYAPGVTAIRGYAFISCTSLQTAIFPSTENGGAQSYAACSALQNIYYGNSINTLGWSLFKSGNTPNVYYAGSEDQWAEVDGTAAHTSKYGGSTSTAISAEKMHYNVSLAQFCTDIGYTLPTA